MKTIIRLFIEIRFSHDHCYMQKKFDYSIPLIPTTETESKENSIKSYVDVLDISVNVAKINFNTKEETMYITTNYVNVHKDNVKRLESEGWERVELE